MRVFGIIAIAGLAAVGVAAVKINRRLDNLVAWVRLQNDHQDTRTGRLENQTGFLMLATAAHLPAEQRETAEAAFDNLEARIARMVDGLEEEVEEPKSPLKSLRESTERLETKIRES
jgi:hypothetical protein